jgi:hypothetical protein
VGRHAARDGGSADPIVAEALALRPETGGAHRAELPRAAAESPVGWPGTPAPEGGGLGWPGDLTDVAGADAAGADPLPEVSGSPVVRRGWRRLFRVSRVA